MESFDIAVFSHLKLSTMSIYDDDFCDLADGSDEPQTSACSFHSSSRFDCGDGIPIFSSRVNDGVIDCANGLDEENRVGTKVADLEVVRPKLSLRGKSFSDHQTIAKIEQYLSVIFIIVMLIAMLGCCRYSNFRFRFMNWLRGEKLPVHVS